MKGATFATAFILTIILVVAGVLTFPEMGQAVTYNNEFVFALFLGPFCVVLFFSWVGEKLVLKLVKKQ
jgi:hypothetical protein